MRTDLVSKGLLSWVGFVSFCMLQVFVHQYDAIKKNSKFFQVGPNVDLHLFGVPIDTPAKYCVVGFYTVVSTVVRTLQQEVVTPWIIQNVQNTKIKDAYTLRHGYFIVTSDVIFRWMDWMMYINILLSQIDFILIEMIGNIAISLYTTKRYLAYRE